MRVCVVSTSWPRAPDDPSGHFVRTEARALAAAGNQVIVVAPDARPEAGLDVIPLRGWGAFGWPGALPRLKQNPLLSFGAARWIQSARHVIAATGPFHHVVAHWALPCAFPIAVDAHGELEIVSHGSDIALLESMPLALRVRIVRTLVARAAVWRFVSVQLLERLSRSLAPGMLANAIVRPCAIEIPDVRARAEDKRREMGGPFVSTVGRLVASKRTERVVEIAAKERMPLVIVGDGPERRRLERTALKSHADARFVGRIPREEALAWMRASNSLWFASEAEGLPTVIREAEALGVPVRML